MQRKYSIASNWRSVLKRALAFFLPAFLLIGSITAAILWVTHKSEIKAICAKQWHTCRIQR